MYLYRYGVDGAFAGDTWHESLEDAHDQVNVEYAGVPIQWEQVPDDVEDVAAFGVGRISSGNNNK